MSWCFAIVNNKLTEIYFKEKKGNFEITGHCYVKKEDYKTKQEQKWIRKDTAKCRFIYQKSKYKKISLS